MTETKSNDRPEIHTNKSFLIGLARAFAGAIVFSFPILMTMEMWWLGFTIEHYRLTLFMFLAIPLLVGLSYYIGFEDTSSLLDDIVDAFVAYTVGFITSAIMLLIFNVINFGMSADEIIGKITVQAVAAAIGAMLAQSELGANRKEKKNKEKKRRNASYAGEMFLMIVGAIFLAMNTAPTEEIILISYQMSDALIIILALFTIILMHAFVYNVEFRGQEKRRHPQISRLSVFLRFTVAGYALVLLVSFYLLWTFGRTDGLGLENMISITIVLGFPAALGAAASRLIL